MLKYTTVENIQLRLAGRLTVPSVMGSMAFAGERSVDPALIESIGAQQEEWIDAYLGMLYVMPLIYPHPILGGIVEKLVISELTITSFHQSYNMDEGSDGGFGAVLRKQGLDALQTLFAGTKITIPGTSPLNNSSSIPGGESVQYRFVPLPGEKLKPYIGVDTNGDGMPDDTNMLTGFNIRKAQETVVAQRNYNQNTKRPIDWYSA